MNAIPFPTVASTSPVEHISSTGHFTAPQLAHRTQELGFLALAKSETALMLVREDRIALAILTLIAWRVRYSAMRGDGLIPGQMFLGRTTMAAELNCSEGDVRGALKRLVKRGLITIRSTKRGSVVTLASSDVYDVPTARPNQQSNPPLTNRSPTDNPPFTINEDRRSENVDRKITHSWSAESEEIYALYPRKESKPSALKAITEALKSSSSEYLSERTRAFAGAVSRWPARDKPRFIPLPATWFNGQRFNDDPALWEKHRGPESQEPRRIMR